VTLKASPAAKFFKRRLGKLRACDRNKKFYDCIIEAMIDLLVADDVPLDPAMRYWIAEEMARLHGSRDRRKAESWERSVVRNNEATLFERVKRAARDSGATPGEAEERALKALGKAVTTEALRKRAFLITAFLEIRCRYGKDFEQSPRDCQAF
jgi:hypothetical protein